ncbi:MAG: hypothetical protein ACRECL_03795, partial [Bradyrhizobium sp.]
MPLASRFVSCDGDHRSQIAAKFRATIDFFANTRRIKLNASTCDLSKTPGSTRDQRDDRGREMFFLLRLAFWLGLVLVLLPREKTPESQKLPQITASEAVQAAGAAVSDMS